MGGLLHFFDFHSNNVARKVFSLKCRDEDLEAPRNSFELQVENLQTYREMKDSQMNSGFEEEWYERSCYPIEASMKMHINEELSKRSNDKQNAPSIVAKLMGVDALPLEAKSAAWMNNSGDPCGHEVKISEKGKRRKGRSPVANCKEIRTESLDCDRYEKPMRREHPQEEELQRFKKEFEAWKAARFKECSRVVDSGNEKQPLINTDHGVAQVMKGSEKGRETGLMDARECDSEFVVPEQKDKLFTRTRSFGRDFNLKFDRAPTKIVVLKPGPQRFYDYEDSLKTMEGSRVSIEEFLEEVKDRLKSELQGRALKRSSSVRGSGIETPFSERPLYDDDNNMKKKSACDGTNFHLPRSESTRSYAGEFQFNAPGSPEFVSRDTRRLLAERLRNVLKMETNPSDAMVSGQLRPTVSDTERRLKETEEILKANDQEDLKGRFIRRGSGYNEVEDGVSRKKDSSPRSLIRSLSAPVSETSFGKLLLEDRHVLTGAQIRRKHEATEQEPFSDPIRRKERFSFRKKVSNFRSSLRGRIFGKKIHSMIESNSFEDEYIKDFITGSTFTSFYDRNENATEVPPSPASVWSNTPEELWRNAEYLSPVSTPDVTIADENGVPRVFRDISSNLSELRRQIKELGSDLKEDAPDDQEPTHEPEFIDLSNLDKAFVRDLLVASGLYDGTSERSLTIWDPIAKLINKSVFQETEENHRKRTKQNSDNSSGETDHNILFDLLNEALTIVLGSSMTKPSLRRKLASSSGLEPPLGKYLLDTTWQIMSEYLYAQTDKPCCSLDGIIAWDLKSSSWNGLIDEEVNVLGIEVEGLIMADLVDDFVKDLQHKLLLPC